MANLATLAPITTAVTALSNLILVSPQSTQGYQPQNPPLANGQPSTAQLPPSFLFHYEGEQVAHLQSDITDHYVEDNTAIQDQWALKPPKISTEGFIGELNDIPPAALAILQSASSKLTTIGAYAPKLTTTAQIAYNEAFLLYQTAANAANSVVSAVSSISGGGGENVIGSNGLQSGAFNPNTGTISNSQTKQQTAFQLFFGYWNSRTLFTVQTPWAVFQNMAIEDLQAIQSEETRMISSFKITFKLIRTASTSAISTLPPVLDSRLNNQASPLNNIGSTTPTPSLSLGSGLSAIA